MKQSIPNKTRHTKLFTVVATLISVSFITNVSNAGEIIFHNEANAKIARLKVKSRILKNTREQDVVPSALGAEAEEGAQSAAARANCGSVDIANQAPPSIGRAPRTTEVFILGDVINTGNNCN